MFTCLCMYAHSQDSADSLQKILASTNPTQPGLEMYLQKMQQTDRIKIDEITAIGKWIIANTNADSLRELQAKTYFALGRVYTLSSRFSEATTYLINARQLAEQYKYNKILAQSLNALGSIYQSNQQIDKAIDFYDEALAVSNRISDRRSISRVMYNIGKLKFYNSNSNKERIQAAHQMLEGFRIIQQLKDTQGLIVQGNGLLGVYLALKKSDSAMLLFGNIEKLIRASENQENYIAYYVDIAKIHFSRKNYKAAIDYYLYGLRIAEKYKTPRILCSYYSGLSETYELAGDYKNANKYNLLNIKMHDEMVSKENFVAAADLQNKYERTQKDNEILRLSAINRKKTLVNTLLVASSILLVVLIFFGFQYFKSRHKIAAQQTALHHQKIIELEKEKQLLAVDAMLKGQEEERSRIAKDLHDGLGGLLSGTKLSLLNVKDNALLSKENELQFNRSLSMLDNTISDLRKVAHNLMPEALLKFGLQEALTDYCNTLQASTGVEVIFQHYGDKRKIDSTASVYIYRIIQELVNNALKHASATQILVQLTTRQNKTEITVEDNGCGFNSSIITDKHGAGLLNVRYRVQYFNGKMDIDSSPGNGTSIQIALMV